MDFPALNTGHRIISVQELLAKDQKSFWENLTPLVLKSSTKADFFHITI